MYVCMYVCMYISISLSLSIYIYIYIYIYILPVALPRPRLALSSDVPAKAFPSKLAHAPSVAGTRGGLPSRGGKKELTL